MFMVARQATAICYKTAGAQRRNIAPLWHSELSLHSLQA